MNTRTAASLAVLLLGASAALGGATLISCTGEHTDGYCLEAELVDAGSAFRASVSFYGDEVYAPVVLDERSEGDKHCFRSLRCTLCLVVREVQLGELHARLCTLLTEDCDSSDNPETHDLGCIESSRGADSESLPLLPDSFTAVIEANLLELNQTLEMRELRDGESGRVRQELHHDDVSEVHLIDVPLGVIARIEEDGACDVRPLEGGGPGGGGAINPVTGRLRSAAELFERTRTGANYTYGGLSAARGITSQVWRENVTHEFERDGVRIAFEYTLEWHFAHANWSWVGSHDHRLPLLAELRGTEYNLTAPGGRDDAANAKAFHHRYEWVGFTPGVPDPEKMRIPAGHGCSLPHNRDLPSFSRNFRVSVEVTLPSMRRTIGRRELYDFDRNRARFDEGADENGVERSVIVDVSGGKQYLVESGPDGVTCSNSDLSPEYGSVIDPAKHHLRPIVPGHPPHLAAADEPEYHYTGQLFAPGRGILCDVWHTRFDNYTTVAHDGATPMRVNFVQTLYFSVDTWRLGFVGGDPDDKEVPGPSPPVPVLIVSQGVASIEGQDDIHFTENAQYVDVSFEEPALSDTDVHEACFPGSDDEGQFHHSSTSGISKGATAGMTVVMTLIGAAVGALLYRRSAQNKHHASLTSSLSTESQLNTM